jgi:PAS domain S-box-containing protein
MTYRMDFGDGEFFTEDFFAAALDGLPDMVHCIDHEGHIVFTNRKEAEALGYTREELLSMTVDEIYATHRRINMRAGLEKLKKQWHAQVEGVLQHKDGSHIPVEIRSVAVCDADGEFIRTVSVLRDLRPVREAERYAAIGEVAACVAHDINGLLQPIAGFAPLLVEELKAAAKDPRSVDFTELAKYAQSVAEACTAAREFTQQVKDTGKCGGMEKVPIDIDDALGGAVALTRIRARDAGVTVEFTAELDTHYVGGNRGELLRSFTNLINNACDAMLDAEERKLTIVIEACTNDAGLELWRCAFTDTGVGIPPENLSRIFQAFFTTKATGTGLGLAGTFLIIGKHNGHIEVASEVGVGTTFEIRLPMVGAPSDESENGASS